ncbi:MAG: WxL protein peptidoglycan domain-containing protein [Acidimicrobiales bacterium]
MPTAATTSMPARRRVRARDAVRKAACAAACAALVALSVSAAFAQQGGVNFVAEPVPGSQLSPTGGFFLLQADPGSEITQAIGLRNDSGETLGLQLAAVDAVTGHLGGASYALAGEQPSRTGAWISLERTAVTLAAQGSVVVPFRVQVPAGAESGHHLAGISIAAPKAAGTSVTPGNGRTGASVDVQTRRVIAVQVNLPGPADPEMVVGGVTPVARPDGLHLQIALENKGRALTKASGTIAVGDDFERDFDVDTFVPRTSIAYPVKWDAKARDGEYPARVELRYGDRVARWEGSFTLGEEVLEDLADRRVGPATSPDGGDASDLPWAALAGALAGAVVFAVAVGAGVARFRRPRGRHSRRS